MTQVTAELRRRVALRLGVLGAVLLVAGALPWATVGPLAARLVALPLLAVGVLVTVTAVRIRSVPAAAAAAPAGYPAEPVEPVPGGCANCACGGCGG